MLFIKIFHKENLNNIIKKKHGLREICPRPQTLPSKDYGRHFYIPYFNPLVSMSDHGKFKYTRCRNHYCIWYVYRKLDKVNIILFVCLWFFFGGLKLYSIKLVYRITACILKNFKCFLFLWHFIWRLQNQSNSP